MNKEEFLNTIKGHVIVSCQAVKGEPLFLISSKPYTQIDIES